MVIVPVLEVGQIFDVGDIDFVAGWMVDVAPTLGVPAVSAVVVADEDFHHFPGFPPLLPARIDSH